MYPSSNLENFTEAIRLDPSKADFYNNRAFSSRKLKSYADAILDYTHSIKINPDNIKTFCNRAICYNKLNKF